MAQMPKSVEVEVHPTFTLARPGDILIIGMDPEVYARLTDAEKYNQEQMIRSRIPDLADALIVPATVMAVYTPDPE